MNIEEFAKSHRAPTRPISGIVDEWVTKQRLQDLLGTPIMAGVVLGDLLTGDGLLDQIPKEVRDGFSFLMQDGADEYQEIRALIQEKDSLGSESIRGLINKIQGQLGENRFAGSMDGARLAASGSQPGWDVAVDRSGGTEYFQVKVYDDPIQAVEALAEVNERAQAGGILDGAQQVRQISLAVNDDILDSAKRIAAERGIPGNIVPIGSTREEIRAVLEQSVDGVRDLPLDSLLGELLGASATAAALHAAVNTFLWSRNAKEANEAVEDTMYSSAVSAGGLAVSHGLAAAIAQAEFAAGILSGPVGAVAILGAGITARAVLKRIADRRYVVERLSSGNESLAILCDRMVQGPAGARC